MKSVGILWIGAALLVVAGVAVTAVVGWRHSGIELPGNDVVYEEVEVKQYHDPPPDNSLPLTDDTLEGKNPAFDENLVDSRPLEGWEVNASAAVIRLDCPRMLPDRDAELLILRPSYSEAVQAAKQQYRQMLPSANLIDGAAKQFDDGLYAAVDLACYRGELGLAPALPDVLDAVYRKLPLRSPARPFLAAALELAGRKPDLDPSLKPEKTRWLSDFESNGVASKPISFYEWTDELKQLWRVCRFLQHEFPLDKPGELAVPRDIARVLEQDAELLGQYQAINAFYGRLTNPLICLPADALIGAKGDLAELTERLSPRRKSVAVLPPSTSREVELFDRLYALGIAPGTNVMTAFIREILAGHVDLAPQETDGWYQYQVYALETMLMPSRGQEGEKLQLTAHYKRRLIEAFKALMTKRRETHARHLATGAAGAEAPPELEAVRPRLRVEPCATFYLRTARAYAFLENFLLATAGREQLKKLHGLKQGGTREKDLAAELGQIKQRFYGFYLVACEDIGMKPLLLAEEPVDQAAAKQAALDWLQKIESDPDMMCDTRVSIPVLVDPVHQTTRLWTVLGVRLAKLEATYAKPPRIRPRDQGGAWQDVQAWQLKAADYVIPVDEFAEIELSGFRALTRREFRAVCDRHKTKAEIVRALSAP